MAIGLRIEVNGYNFGDIASRIKCKKSEATLYKVIATIKKIVGWMPNHYSVAAFHKLGAAGDRIHFMVYRVSIMVHKMVAMIQKTGIIVHRLVALPHRIVTKVQ